MAYKKDYMLAELYAQIISAVGWLILLVAGLFLIVIDDILGFTTPFLIKFFAFILVGSFGLFAIIVGQFLRAVVDNTNANREILWVLKSRKDPSPSTYSTKGPSLPLSSNKQRKDAYKNIFDKKPSKKEDMKVNWDKVSEDQYTKDGIKFKSKKEMEAYISNRYPDLESSDKE